MKNTVLLLICIIISKITCAQTTISGTLTANTNWGIAGSPYHVTGDVKVPAGITVIIDPGVQIDFKGDYQILIESGIIISQGTNLLPITFSGSAAGKAMLLFKSADLSKSTFYHTAFNGPKTAIQLADEVMGSEDIVKNQDTLLLDASSITNTNLITKGINTTSQLRMTACTLSTVSISTIYNESEGTYLEKCNLKDCKITSNTQAAYFSLENCMVTTTSFIAERLTLSNSTISESVFSDALFFVQAYHVRNCMLTNSPMDIPRTQLWMNNCTFNYNSPIGMRLGLGYISCSQFTGNNQGTALNLVSWVDGVSVGTFAIHNNTFSQNKIAIEIAADLPSQLYNLDSNNFFNNSLYHIKNLSSQAIAHFASNYWGATDSAQIADKIYDFYDTPACGTVYISNFLKAPYYSPICKPLVTSVSDLKLTLNTSFDLTLYPNPTSSTVLLKLENFAKPNRNATVQILNPGGQLIFEQQFNSSKMEAIDVSAFGKGLYFCKVKIDEEQVVKKLLIQ